MKKIISLVLVIFMIATTIPVAFATNETETHIHSMSTDCSTSNGEQIAFEPIDFNQEGGALFYGGNYYLTDNYSGTVVVYSNNTKICLNGHNLSNIHVYGNLEICDCKGSGEICNSSESRGSCIELDDNVVCSMYGGRLYNPSFYEAAKCINVGENATFNFYGGSMFAQVFLMEVNAYGTVNLYSNNIVCCYWAERSVYGTINNEGGFKQCSHLCHKGNNFYRWFWFYINLFNQIFGISETCKCGILHY